MAKGSLVDRLAPFPFHWSASSDIGKVRDENQDTFLVGAELALFLVSDGMGGHQGGAIASKIVVEDLPVMVETKLDELRTADARSIRSLLREVVTEQSGQLRLEGTSETGFEDMGATLAMALLRDKRAYVANLGDSRIYRFRKGRLLQLTKDHSVVSELLDKGHIKPEQFEDHPGQGQLTCYIGMEEKALPYVRSFLLKEGDRLLLCTDGLTDVIEDKGIAAVLRDNTDSRAACEVLVDAANAAGGYDNVTVVIIDWVGRS